MIINFEHTNLPKEIQSQLNLQHSESEKTQIKTITIQEYSKKLMEANEIVTIHKIVSCIRIVFTDADHHRIEELVQSGLVPYFIHLAREQISPQLTTEITWILINAASGNQAQTLEIVNNGGIQLFVELLESNEKYIQDHAIWGLGNISGDSTTYRDIIVSSGAIEYIIKAFKKKCSAIDVRNMVWCLSNLCKGNPLPKYEVFLLSMCIEIFCYAILHESNEEILADALWALSYLNSRPCGDEEASEIIIQSKIIYRLIELLDHKSLSIQLPALRIIVNILTGDEISTDQVLQAGLLRNIPQMLQHSKKVIRKETCWALSNITAKGQSQITQVIKNEEILNLILLSVETEQLEVVKEIANILSNSVCNVSVEDLQFFMEKGLLRSYKTILERFVDQNIIKIVIEGIIQILNKGNGSINQLNSEEIQGKF